MASTINASNSGFGGIVSTGDSSGQLQLQTANTTAVTIDTSQNVGIGTTSPTNKLTVSASAGTIAKFTDGTTPAQIYCGGGYFGFFDGAGGNGLGGLSASNYVYFQTNSTERMRIDSSGRVGINNTSPIAVFNPVGSAIYQRYSGGYNTYGRIEVYATQSNFTNPTVDLFTTTITGSTFAGCMIKVRVFQLNWGAAQGNVHAGNAIICGNGAGSYTTNVAAMAIEGSNFTMTNVGTLSWSGTTLRYTCNRASNYDTYTITVEYGAHQNLISMVPASANLV